MRIGIVGSDDRAVAIGRLLRSGGHQLTLSDPATPGQAQRAASLLGVRDETPYAQAMAADLLVLAVPARELDRTLRAFGSTPVGVVVDAVTAEHGKGARSGAQLLARKLDSYGVVRALISAPQPGANVPICGDDEESKRQVEEAFQACGCIVTDRGTLSRAAELEAPLAA